MTQLPTAEDSIVNSHIRRSVNIVNRNENCFLAVCSSSQLSKMPGQDELVTHANVAFLCTVTCKVSHRKTLKFAHVLPSTIVPRLYRPFCRRRGKTFIQQDGGSVMSLQRQSVQRHLHASRLA